MPTSQTANSSPIPILVYHQIEQAPPKGAAFRSLYVSPRSFARQMALLKLLGYQGLSMSQLLPYLKGQRSGKVVGITFDDGYLNNLNHALPVLSAHGFSSTCYAVSQFLGKTNAWDQAAGIAPTALMSAAQLRTWAAAGQEVGAHTRAHVHLPQTQASAAKDEILGCKSELEDLTGCAVKHFCYPYGEYASEHVALAREAGFETVTTTRRSRCHVGADMMQLPRVPVLRSTTWPVLAWKLMTAYEDRRGLR
jgi:peptidoglycan/xylan/chitin deacetylase (PgdA/CDA1 family)